MHPSGALFFTPHHLQLTLLQHLIIQSPFLKQPVQFLADIPKYWLENDGTMCLDDSHRWQIEETIAWLRKHDLHTVSNSIKAKIEDLVYNGPKKKSLDETATFAPPPGRFVHFTGSRASNYKKGQHAHVKFKLSNIHAFVPVWMAPMMLRNFRLVAAQSSPVSPLGQLDYREGWFAIIPREGQPGETLCGLQVHLNDKSLAEFPNRDWPAIEHWAERGLLKPDV